MTSSYYYMRGSCRYVENEHYSVLIKLSVLHTCFDISAPNLV